MDAQLHCAVFKSLFARHTSTSSPRLASGVCPSDFGVLAFPRMTKKLVERPSQLLGQALRIVPGCALGCRIVSSNTSAAVRRAKTDRLDAELLKRAFLGSLRGERGRFPRQAWAARSLDGAAPERLRYWSD
jgi:hypothetical protein